MTTIKIHNVETDEIIEREMTNQELATWQEQQAMAIAEKEAAEAREDARLAALAKLGLTADEIAALGL